MLDATRKIAGLKSHIPEALTGVVGINFFGGVLTSIVLFLFVAILLIGTAMGLFSSALISTYRFNIYRKIYI